MAIYAPGVPLVTTVISMTVVAFLVLTARIVSRVCTVNSFGSDDGCVILAMVSAIAMSATIVMQAHHGLGSDTAQISELDRTEQYRYFYISVAFYNAAIGLVKISILLQYLRIFTTKKMRLACGTILFFTCLSTLVWAALSLVGCEPVSYFWDKSTEGGHCLDFGAVWLANASVNIAFDMIIVFLPMPVIKSLNISRKQKIALMAIFAIGLFAAVTSILRLVAVYHIAYSHDITHDNFGVALWSTIEVNTAIICASLPAFISLVGRIFPRLMQSTRTIQQWSCKFTRTPRESRAIASHGESSDLESGNVGPSQSRKAPTLTPNNWGEVVVYVWADPKGLVDVGMGDIKMQRVTTQEITPLPSPGLPPQKPCDDDVPSSCASDSLSPFKDPLCPQNKAEDDMSETDGSVCKDQRDIHMYREYRKERTSSPSPRSPPQTQGDDGYESEVGPANRMSNHRERSLLPRTPTV